MWDSIVCNDVTGLFFAGYMVFQLPGGRLAEILGGKRVMTVAMGGVALLSLLIPSAAKLGGHTGYPYYLVILRIVMGLFEAATFPCITSMLARWAPQSERSTMSTLIMAGSQAGTIVGFFVSGLLVRLNTITVELQSLLILPSGRPLGLGERLLYRGRGVSRLAAALGPPRLRHSGLAPPHIRG